MIQKDIKVTKLIWKNKTKQPKWFFLENCDSPKCILFFSTAKTESLAAYSTWSRLSRCKGSRCVPTRPLGRRRVVDSIIVLQVVSPETNRQSPFGLRRADFPHWTILARHRIVVLVTVSDDRQVHNQCITAVAFDQL